MTEKQPQLKSAHLAEAETATDPTVVDAAHTFDDEKRESTPPDSEPPEFSPGKFSRIEIPLELRKEMLQAKLPRLAPEFFQDTVPPNHPLEAPPPASDAGAAVATKRRAPAIVIACLIGAVFVLALAFFRSLLGRPEPTLPTPTPTSATESPAAPTHAAAAVTPPPVTPKPPVLSDASPQPAPPKREPEQPPAATSAHHKGLAVSKSTHSAQTSASQDSAVLPPAPTPSAPTTNPINPAPARSSWFHK